VERLASSVASLTRWASPPEKGGGGLTHPDIAETDIVECFQLTLMAGKFLKNSSASSTVISRTSAIFLSLNLISRASTVIAFALADFAWDGDIGQELHFDLHVTFAAAGFAASAFDIKENLPAS